MATTNDSEVVIHNGGTTYAGPDAMKLFRAITLRSSISMYRRTGVAPTRGVGIKRMLAIASEYSGKTYKLSEAEKAEADLQRWIDTMKAGLPITDERKPL